MSAFYTLLSYTAKLSRSILASNNSLQETTPENLNKRLEVLEDEYQHNTSEHELLDIATTLMICHSSGIGCPKDYEKAYSFILAQEKRNNPIYTSYCYSPEKTPILLYPYLINVDSGFCDYCRTVKNDPSFEVGYALFQCKDDAEKISILNKYKDVDCRCALELAKALRYGLYGIEKDEKAAYKQMLKVTKMYGESIDGGCDSDFGMFEIAEYYDQGIGTPKNEQKCLKILRKKLVDIFELNLPEDHLPVLEENAEMLSGSLFEKYFDRICNDAYVKELINGIPEDYLRGKHNE